MKLGSEAIEFLGAMGYIEDTVVPTLFRDSQVLTIWEGTTNVLCHDFVRAIKKEKSALEVINMVFI